MMQLDLLADAPPLARRTDPTTSHQAAADARELVVVAPAPALSVDELRRLLSFEPSTGELKWRPEPLAGTKRARMAGCRAGAPDSKGYIKVKVAGQTYTAARIAWAMHYGEWPPETHAIDHINLEKADNRICNLRLATRSENRRNNAGNRGTQSGLRGVYPHGKKWSAVIWESGRLRRLGSFDDPQEASRVFMAAAAARYGEFKGKPAPARTTELQRAGLIRPTGRTVVSTAGRLEREWEVVQ